MDTSLRLGNFSFIGSPEPIPAIDLEGLLDASGASWQKFATITCGAGLS
jgi:hypothetical protein